MSNQNCMMWKYFVIHNKWKTGTWYEKLLKIQHRNHLCVDKDKISMHWDYLILVLVIIPYWDVPLLSIISQRPREGKKIIVQIKWNYITMNLRFRIMNKLRYHFIAFSLNRSKKYTFYSLLTQIKRCKKLMIWRS